MRTIAITLFALAGCIDEFSGSELQIDFSPTTPVQASAFAPARTNELPNNIHFTLYALDESKDSTGAPVSSAFELTRFEIHHIVDLDSPCFIDVGEHVPFPGLHVSQYEEQMKEKTGIDDPSMPPSGASEESQIEVATAIQRQRIVEEMAADTGPRAITSASVGGYPAVAADCDSSGIPPAMCVTKEQNQRRLDACNAAWNKEPDLFEGTDRVLTAPLNGTTYGFVNGSNPVNSAPIGGSAFFVDESLENFEGYAIYWQYDDADNDGMPDYPASVPADQRTKYGTLFLYGTAERPTRGVIHTHMINISNPQITAELAVFPNIHEDDVHF